MELDSPPGPLQESNEVGGVELVEGRAIVDLVGLGGPGEQLHDNASPAELIHHRSGEPGRCAHRISGRGR